MSIRILRCLENRSSRRAYTIDMAVFPESHILQAASEALKRLGYSELRPQQEEVVRKFVQGHNVFVSLPTGSGKSLCTLYTRKQYWQTSVLANRLVYGVTLRLLSMMSHSTYSTQI